MSKLSAQINEKQLRKNFIYSNIREENMTVVVEVSLFIFFPQVIHSLKVPDLNLSI